MKGKLGEQAVVHDSLSMLLIGALIVVLCRRLLIKDTELGDCP